jgi:hypothetical protein
MLVDMTKESVIWSSRTIPVKIFWTEYTNPFQKLNRFITLRIVVYYYETVYLTLLRSFIGLDSIL